MGSVVQATTLERPHKPPWLPCSFHEVTTTDGFNHWMHSLDEGITYMDWSYPCVGPRPHAPMRPCTHALPMHPRLPGPHARHPISSSSSCDTVR